MAPSRLVVAGLCSGSGKTSIMVGLAVALRRRGIRVACFKAGPDYLDPTYHAAASGRVCHNLDPWMMGVQGCRETFEHESADADVALIEGVMGLFDGERPDSDGGSTAELAQILDAEVALCVDVSGMARTVVALVAGVQAHAPQLRLFGVIANRAGSDNHLSLLRTALSSISRPVPLLGGLKKRAAEPFPERHLGLFSAAHGGVGEDTLAGWGEAVAAGLDLSALLASLSVGVPEPPEEPPSSKAPPPERVRSWPVCNGAPQCRIAVARDDALHFYYEFNLRALRAAGAQLVWFSPLRDRELPEADGVMLGGGYPEVHAARLSQNQEMFRALRAHAAAGGVLYAECGGLMLLCEGITTVAGERFPMAGLIPGWAIMASRLEALGYVEVITRDWSPLGPAGTVVRGHEFRYSHLATDVPATRYGLTRRRDGQTRVAGWGTGSTLASYVHLHWARTPQVAEAFVAACARRRGPDTKPPLDM